MSDLAAATPVPDLNRITDADTRRALRAIHQQSQAAVERQQQEIQALLECMIEKHVTSLGEFRRHLAKLQQHTARSDRITEAMGLNAPQVRPAPVPAPAPKAAQPGERIRYTL